MAVNSPLVSNGFCTSGVIPDYYLNTWIPLVSLEEMEKNENDVLIVGSGAGGGAALWRLCQQWRNKNKKIGVIEAGNLLLPTHVNNIPTIAVNARAVQIRNQPGGGLSVIAALPNQRRYELRSRTVILSANVFNTPRLLLTSGIQSQNIGHYLVHHPFLVSNLTMKPSDPNHKNIYPRKEGIILTVFTKVESRYQNRIYLDYSRRDIFGQPCILTEFNPSNQDRMVFAQAEDEIQRFAQELGVSIESLCTKIPGSDYHLAGTCRMGMIQPLQLRNFQVPSFRKLIMNAIHWALD